MAVHPDIRTQNLLVLGGQIWGTDILLNVANCLPSFLTLLLLGVWQAEPYIDTFYTDPPGPGPSLWESIRKLLTWEYRLFITLLTSDESLSP